MGTLRRLVLNELSLLTRHRHVVVANVSLVVVLGFVSSLLTGEQFRAHTTILPPMSDGPGSIGRFVRRLPTGLSFTGPVTIMDEVLVVVQSRRVVEPVLERHDLREVYAAKSLEGAYWTFQDRLVARLDRADVLHLELRDRSPERAAEVLNALVDELNTFYTETRRSRGRLMAELIAARLDSTSRRVAALEVGLGAHQAASHAVYPSPEATSALARITARAMMLEVELDALSHIAGATSPLGAARRAELASIREELRRQPVVELEALRLSRELAVQQRLREMLTTELVAAQALAAREMPFVEPLDRAEPIARRIWPGHARIVAASFLIGVASAFLIVHLVAFVERNRAPLRELGRERSAG